MKKKQWGILAVLCLKAALSWAAEEMDLDDFIRLGLEESRSLKSNYYQVMDAEAKVREAQSLRIPSLSLSAGYTRLSEESLPTVTIPLPPPAGPQSLTLGDSYTDAFSLRLDLRYPIFSGFRVRDGIELAKTQAEIRKREYGNRKADLVLDMTRLFWETLRAEEAVRVIGKNLELSRIHGEEIGHLAAAGLATREDILKVEMNIARTELLLIEAETGAEIALLRLKTLAGIPADREARPAAKEGRDASKTYPDLKKLLELALLSRGELRAFRDVLRSRELSRSLARADLYPSLVVTGGYTVARPNSRIFPPEDAFRDSWEVGVAAKIELGGFPGTLARISREETGLLSSMNDFEALKERITLEVTEAYLRLKKAEQEAAVSAANIARAEESLRVVEEKFKNGLAKSSDVLEEQNNLLRAELSATAGSIDRTVASAALERAIGAFDE
jgi:outer membrane protein TolC